MKDSHLEILALIGIIAGLCILFFFVLDYEPKDAFYLTMDDENSFLDGELEKISYNEESDFSYLKIRSCRVFDAFYEGKISINNSNQELSEIISSAIPIRIEGSFIDGKFNIENLKANSIS